jgi:hypothetical protein
VALHNSLKKTMNMEDELVRKSRNVSAGRLRERWEEIDRMNAVKVCRQAAGKLFSFGRIGKYHHLDNVNYMKW